MLDSSPNIRRLSTLSTEALQLASALAVQMVDDERAWYAYNPGETMLSVRGHTGDWQQMCLGPRMLANDRLIGVVRPFTHLRSHFEVVLPKPDKAMMRLGGRVMECAYATTGVHVLLLRLERPVNVLHFCGPRARPAHDPKRLADKEDAKPTLALDAPLLAIVPDRDEWAEIEFEISNLGFRYEHVTTLGAGLDCLKQRRYSAVLTDSVFDDLRLPGVLSRLKAVGHKGKILALAFNDRSQNNPNLPTHHAVIRPLNAAMLLTMLKDANEAA